jgi:diaminopimelate decarboxylase
VKANPHPVLVAAVAALGVDVEISSTGELAAVLAAGIAADRALYTGPAKTVDELAHAVREGVRRFSVESEPDRDRLVAAAGSPVDYLVRLHADRAGGAAGAVGLRMTGAPAQFGVDAAALRPGAALLEPAGSTRPVGFHVFSATNIADEDALLAEFEAAVVVAAGTAERTGFTPAVVDLGGGFGAPFAVPGDRPDYPRLRAGLARLLDARLPGWRRGTPAVAVESGRYLMAAAGTLLTTVMDVKSRAGRTFVICDAGVNALGGMSGLGRLLPAAQPRGRTGDAAPVVLVGPLCTPLDVLSRSARVGQPAAGDVLAVPNVGAYGLTASLVAFLGRPLPVEVVIDGDRVVDARQMHVTSSVSAGDGAR